MAGIEESKSTGGKKKNERMACDFVYFSNVDTSAHSFFCLFFLIGHIFQTTFLQEEKSDRFSMKLISGRASTKHKSFEKAGLIFNNTT